MTSSPIRVSAGGAELAVWARGKRAPPILFIHGFPFDHTLWRHQFAALPRWRRVVPDLRGAGFSSTAEPPAGYSMASYADDLVGVLDALDIGKAVVCGLSMGGYILFELLRRHAQRVRAAIFCNTKAEADSEQSKRDRDAMAELAERGGAGAVAEKLLPRLLAHASVETQPAVGREVRDMMARAPVTGIVGALRAMRDRPDSTAMLGAIRVPVLVLAAEDDQITPANGMQAMAGAIAGARFALIPSAGHVAPLEQPLAVSAAIADFVAGLG